MECKRTDNSSRCPCLSTGCDNHGVCCDCLASHLAKKTLPRCCFGADESKAKDRSFANFARVWNL